MPTRILVIRAGQLGDTAYASSIIEPLRNHYGTDTIIDWVAKAGLGKIFLEDPRINKIFQVKSRRTPLLFNRAKQNIIFHSWSTPYDLVINLELGNIFNNMVRLIKARKKIGMPYKYFAEPPETHAVDNLKLIFASFLDADDLESAFPSLIGTDPDIIKHRFNLPDNYFILVPANSHIEKSSSINHRAWPIDHWKTLMQMMDDKRLNAVIIGGKSEHQFFKQFEPLPKNVISLVGETNFPQLIGLIQGSKGVITTDTGPSHIAAAVNTPVYALIGPTNYKRTGPYKTASNQVHIITANLECSPCYHTERLTNCLKSDCMIKITPSQVINSIMNIIN
jgi:ADP-heptose:LPS heptosyltransferase